MSRQSDNQRGLSLVEVSIVSCVMVIMSLVIIHSIRNLSVTQTNMAMDNKLSSLTDRIIAEVEQDLTFASRVFTEGTYASGQFGRLDFGDFRPLDGSRFPTATTIGTFEQDPEGAVQTGNMLFMARQEGHEVIDTTAAAGADEISRVDVMRFVVWMVEAGSETGVDLSRWASVRVAKRTDIEAFADAGRQARIGQRLHELGIRYTWDPTDGSPDTSFGTIDGSGALATLGDKASIPGDSVQSVSGIFGIRHLGIAANFTTTHDVPKYAQPTSTFPHGFEVKRDGDGTGDLVLVRIVGASKGGEGRRVAVAEAERRVAFREE